MIIPLIPTDILLTYRLPFLGNGDRIEYSTSRHSSPEDAAISRILREADEPIRYLGHLPANTRVFHDNESRLQVTEVLIENPPPNLLGIALSRIHDPRTLANQYFVHSPVSTYPIDFNTLLLHPLFGFGTIQGIVAITSCMVQLLVAFRLTQIHDAPILWVGLWVDTAVVDIEREHRQLANSGRHIELMLANLDERLTYIYN